MSNGSRNASAALRPARGASFGRLLVLPSVAIMQVVWALSIWWTRGLIEEKLGSGPRPLLAVYGAGFIVIYFVLRVIVSFQLEHLREAGELRVFGLKPQALYHRTGASLIDGLGLMLALVLLFVSLMRAPLYVLAPLAALSSVGFLAGLTLGRNGPWPTRRRSAG